MSFFYSYKDKINEEIKLSKITELFMLKKVLVICLLFFVGCESSFGAVFSKTNKSQQAELKPITEAVNPVVPQPVEYSNCFKVYNINSNNLFYLTLASVNANRFTVNEIQTDSGYILFSVVQRQFLASVIGLDANRALLKITPCNNYYYFPIGIVQNMFKYVELNLNTPVEKLGTM